MVATTPSQLYKLDGQLHVFQWGTSSAHRSPQCGPREQSYQALAPFPTAPGYSWKLFAGFGFNRKLEKYVGWCCLLLLAPYFFTAALGIGFEPPACARWKKALVSSDYIHWFNIHWLCSIPLHLLLSEHQSGWVSGNSSREFGYSVANHFLNCHLALRFLS